MGGPKRHIQPERYVPFALKIVGNGLTKDRKTWKMVLWNLLGNNMETGILYVVFNKWICDPETKEMPYKIGITKNSIDERYYGLGLKMPGKFETLFAYRIKDYTKAEKSIQDIFNKNCVNGE
jgi:hypothetical protein